MNQRESYHRLRPFLFLTGGLCVGLVVWAGLAQEARAGSETNGDCDCSQPCATYPAETNIWQRVMAGQVGNEGTNRNSVRACFLVYLLQNTNLPHQGVQITNIIIEGALDLVNMMVEPAVSLKNCEFQSNVDFSSAHFRKGLSLAGTVFHQQTSFDDAAIDGNLDISQAAFCTDAVFTHVRVGADLAGEGTWFGGDANFAGLDVGHAAKFDSGSRLLTFKTNELMIDEICKEFENSNIVLSARSRLVKIDDQGKRWRLLDGTNHRSYSLWVKKRDPKIDVGLTNEQYVEVKRATYFSANVDMSGGSVAKQLTAGDAYFAGDASFDSLKVDDSVYVGSSAFDGKVSWGFAGVAGQFSAEWAWFNYAANVNFYGFHCAECLLDGAALEGGLNFQNALVSGDLRAAYSVFGAHLASDFLASRVKGTCDFSGADFQGPVRFLLTRIGGNFIAKDAAFTDMTPATNLSQTANSRVTFTANADFGAMNVDGFAIFSRAQFKKIVSFRHAVFQNLILNNVIWPTNSTDSTNLVRFEDMKYELIQAGAETNGSGVSDERKLSDTWKAMSEVFKTGSSYSVGAYKDLEAFFAREGRPDLADEVFLEGKRLEIMSTKSWLKRCFKWFLYGTIGYGRRPSMAMILSAVIVGFGAWLLGRSSSLSRKGGGTVQWSDCLWYTFDVFVPLLDLKTNDRFELDPGHKKVQGYLYCCRAVGLLLIPIWAAALAGLIN